MSATQLTSGFRRLLGASAAMGALVLVFAGMAFAGNDNGNGGGNGNGCDAPGHAYGHDNCDPPADPSPPPPEEPATPPAEEPPAEEPSIETEPADEPADDVAPAEGSDDEEQSAPSQPEADETGGSPEPTNPGAPEANATAPSRPTPAPPSPGPPVAGWAPVVGREQSPPAPPAPQPTARRGRTFSSASAPDASWGAGQPDASWGASEANAPNARDYGITGTGAVITIRRSHGVFGGLSFRVSMNPGSSTFAFHASRSVVAGAGGRLYRIGAWLRSGVPGLTVCLRIQEVSPSDPLTAVRTSESCLAPAAKWKRFRLFRRTLASGNRLVFSIYSYGATSGDSFEVDGFTVARRVKNGWKRVDAAFGDAGELR